MEDIENKSKKIVFIILGVIIGLVVLAVSLVFILTSNSDKMVCKSSKGNITILYNEKGITGYTAYNVTYNLEEQQKYAKEIGINKYLKEFNEFFTNNTDGSCTIDGKSVLEEEKIDTKVVGSSEYGYITIPSNFSKFVDVDGNDSLQFSYLNQVIVTLNVREGTNAKGYATSFMTYMQNSNEVDNVTIATVKIGKNKEYEAYQVYMYYPSDDIYLITYWFSAEDGKTHYISLEGKKEVDGVKLTDYLYIPESFSLK